MFPKIGVPPNHPILIGFSIINHPFWGTTISETSIYLTQLIASDRVQDYVHHIFVGVQGCGRFPNQLIFFPPNWHPGCSLLT